MNSEDLQGAIDRARSHAPFLAMLLDRESQLVEDLEHALDDPLKTARIFDGEMVESRRLRIERRRLALLVALGEAEDERLLAVGEETSWHCCRDLTAYLPQRAGWSAI